MPPVSRALALLATLMIGLTPMAPADSNASGKAEDERWTLERIFPERSFFGPVATSPAFSHDGRYAAFLWRPWLERRHGQDLWLLEVATGEVTRLTAVSVMKPFQEATRKVAEDRRRTARSRGGERQNAAVRADDGVSGEWRGTLDATEYEELGSTMIDFALTLSVEVSANRAPRKVEGTMRIDEHSATITEGSLDSENRLRCTITDPETGLTGELEVVIEGESMQGTLSVPGLNAVLGVQGQRTEAASPPGSNDRGSEQNDVDQVDEKDAEASRAPRYGGIQSFEWSPVADELLFVAAGDLYRMQIPSREIERLTRTSDPVRSPAWLPEGNGFTFLRDNRLFRVRFGDHRIEQISPDLASGVTLASYRLSPCGTRLALLATSGTSMWSTGIEVNIVNYRGRFAGVQRVRRHMPDGPIPEFNYHWYAYELRDTFTERQQPMRVASHRMSGARDVATTPNWSEASDRFAFAIYEQSSDQVRIMEVRMPAPMDDQDAEEKAEANADQPALQAGVIYRFLHHGGPNTPRMIDPLYTSDGHHLVFVTEVSGFRHLHRLDPLYEQLEQLTRGRFEVYPFAMSKDRDAMFALTTRTHPADQVIDRIDLETGKITGIGADSGFHDRAAVSPCGHHAVATRRDFGAPTELYHFAPESEQPLQLTDSHSPEAHALTAYAPTYFTYHNRHGHEIHGHMFMPSYVDPEAKHPLLIYVYGGPLGTRKMISRGDFAAPSYFFARYMAETHGYITVTIDPRGASGFGGLFEKSNFEQVGKPQVEDLVDGANWLAEHFPVDRARIGLHGWSFGGFQTQMCLYTKPGFFACGIAGAGPTEWENYNTWYTSGTIGPADPGKVMHERFSLLPLAKNLEDRLLLVHGVEDSNVLYQDTMRVYRELLKAGKETLVELFLDPTGGHGLGGDVKTIGRYRKYEAFLLQCMGQGPLPPPEEKDDEEEEASEVDSDESELSEGGGLIELLRRHQGGGE